MSTGKDTGPSSCRLGFCHQPRGSSFQVIDRAEVTIISWELTQRDLSLPRFPHIADPQMTCCDEQHPRLLVMEAKLTFNFTLIISVQGFIPHRVSRISHQELQICLVFHEITWFILCTSASLLSKKRLSIWIATWQAQTERSVPTSSRCTIKKCVQEWL